MSALNGITAMDGVRGIIDLALRELGAFVVEGDDHATAWLLAIDWKAGRFEDRDGYTRTAVRSLALALAAGNAEAAREAARYITDGDEAILVGLAEARLRARLALLGWRDCSARVFRPGLGGWRAVVTHGSSAWIVDHHETPEQAASAMLDYMPSPASAGATGARRVA